MHNASSFKMQVNDIIKHGFFFCLLTPALIVVPSIHATGAEDDKAAAPAKNVKKAAPKTVSPEVQAVVATNPRTPDDWARAAELIARLGEPELAKSYLKKILDANLNQQQLLELVDRFSGAMFVNMSSNPALAPEAKQLADKIFAAVEKQRNAPGRIDALIKQLADKSPDKHFRAMEDLLSTGSAAVEPLIRVLADPARSAEHPNIRRTLARMGSDATRPLIALLESGDPALVVQAILTLSETGSKNATVYLLAPCMSPESPTVVRSAAAAALLNIVGAVPSQEQAARVLTRQAREYYDHRLNL
ncbi:MAG: HEAT repeat domain-containing protein, partial [Pirellulales bacterium]|nr:HEAT repeat domain-containing protein [Pirellulales bacterium]